VTDQRPEPDALLARLREEEARAHRGKLKVFLGATAGVGKTYSMLEAARGRRAAGVDVVAGYVEPHGRPETEGLLAGLEQLPPRLVEYHGTRLRELDLDAALARRPALILVDELAHTNAPGSRHAKRWQDVLELLEAGIDVYTTVNIQHLESLNDVVARITGVTVRETVPDSVLETADEVELVDLPPDDLLQRLREGKVYVPEQAERAARKFFRKGNLIALRELALRLTAARVDAEMEVYRREHAVPGTWPVSERILVAVSPSPLAARVVRTARRMAAAMRAEWVVATVRPPGRSRLSEAARDRIVETLGLAERLGAETVTLTGHDVADELVRYARTRNVSKIVLGKTRQPRWREMVFGSVVNELVRKSGDIDVHVITGEGDDARPRSKPPVRPSRDWAAYGKAVAVVAATTAVAWAVFPLLQLSNLVMVYFLGVVFAATRLGRGPSILASVLSVAVFDVLFVPPYLSFAVSDTEYVVTFAVMLVVALVTSTLAVRVREQADQARYRERRTAALYAVSRDLARARSADDVTAVAVRHVVEVFGSAAVILTPDDGAGMALRAGRLGEADTDVRERAVARWVYDHEQPAGHGSATLPGARALYLPLRGSRGPVGVLAVQPGASRILAVPDQLHLLETFAAQTGIALERARLAEEAQQATVTAETERLRSALLSAVSHDLRTPLATITGATSSLLDGGERLDAATRQELLEVAHEEAERLNRLVRNLLDMTRLEAGAVQIRKEWHPLEEIVGAALNRLERRLADRPVTTRIPDDLPLVPLDGVLIEQVLLNLLDNALRHTPSGSPIEVSAALDGDRVRIEVADRGPGVRPGDEARVFDRFYRGRSDTADGGVGLGLTVCKGIVEAHGGRIEAINRPAGGVAVRFTLPLGEKPPAIPSDAEGEAPEPGLVDRLQAQ
jgi:two-component system sensor histidine kinase KdpD